MRWIGSDTRTRAGPRWRLAGIERSVRPFYDGRHTAITNAAAAGLSPAALQGRSRALHMSTTQRYIDLAGVSFCAEVQLAQARIFGTSVADGGAHDE